MRRHAILTSVGTDGDIHPFLSLGCELRQRGFRVTLATHQHFAAHAEAEGLEFAEMVSAAETERLLEQAAFWHPLKSGVVVARWGARLVRRQYNLLAHLASEDAFLISAPGVVAARLVQEKTGIPLASVVLQPWLLPSVHDPPVMTGGLTLPRRTPQFLVKLYFRIIDKFGTRLMGTEFKELRGELGLAPLRRMFQWWLSPSLILGLFPEWFGPPQLDWPKHVRLVGFPLIDGDGRARVSESLLQFCQAGQPPVAVTFGTGMRHAAQLFRSVVESCLRLGKRAVLVTTCPSQLPKGLPQSIQHCHFAPFRELFPLCSLVIHHGGIGTVAKALAAGTPQLIIPFAFDQLDNAMRVRKLGVGNWLKPKQCQPRALGPILAACSTGETQAAALRVARRCDAQSGLRIAADEVEALLERG